MTYEVFAPAKINLTLHVTGQRADGYHLLDSLVAFASIGDRLRFAEDGALSIAVTGSFADGVPTDQRNLVWRAAKQANIATHITLEKNLPHGAGIGGGSADAAAVLRYAGVTTGAAALGADVPVCLASRVQRMCGIGDELTPLAPLPPVWAVLVNPQIHLPTPDVFAALPNKINAAMPPSLPHFRDTVTLIDWLSQMRNDLEKAAISLAPEIAQVLSALADVDGAGLARMSGSGATCFGLFSEAQAADAAQRDLARCHPRWWVQACQLS